MSVPRSGGDFPTTTEGRDRALSSSDNVPSTSKGWAPEPGCSDNVPSTSGGTLKETRRRRNRLGGIEWLQQTVPDENAAVLFLRGKGLLHSERMCPCCGQGMHLALGGMFWRCYKRSCRRKFSVRSGTWFGVPRERLPLRNAVQLIYHWSQGHATIKFCVEQLGICSQAAVRWCRYLRQLAADALAATPVRLGGPGMTVEMDESLFSRSKYNRGRRYPGKWVFGAVSRESGATHLEAVEERSSRSLVPIIRSHVERQSAVVTDEWRAYRSLGHEGYHHSRVNHSRNFVDRATGAHTQTIESLWAQVKRGNKLRCGTHRSALALHLSEFMWRRRIGTGDAFDAILDVILQLHPPRQGEPLAQQEQSQSTDPSEPVGSAPTDVTCQSSPERANVPSPSSD